MLTKDLKNNDDLAEQLREANFARSDIDGKYCAESLFD